MYNQNVLTFLIYICHVKRRHDHETELLNDSGLKFLDFRLLGEFTINLWNMFSVSWEPTKVISLCICIYIYVYRYCIYFCVCKCNMVKYLIISSAKVQNPLHRKGMKRFQIIQYYGCCSFHTILPKDPFKQIYKTPLSQRIIPPRCLK